MTYLQFDSFLAEATGWNAYSVLVSPDAMNMSALDDEIRKCSAGKRFFASVKVPAEDVAIGRAFSRAGFYLVDTNLIFERKIVLCFGQVWKEGVVRPAHPDDEESVRTIAKKSLVSSRFHLDPCFPESLATSVKELWAGNFFSGKRGDAMFVAETGGVCIGFLLLLFDQQTIVIDLVAVDENARRLGAASAMIKCAMEKYSEFDKIIVGTQAANLGGAQFYESLGFRLSKAQYVFHAHGGQE